MNDEPVVDAQAFERLMKIGGPRFAANLIGVFLDYVPGKVAEARAGLEAGDLEAVRRAAHPIKSSASNLGALALRDLAARIEQLATANNTRAVVALFPEFEAAYQRVAEALQVKRGELTSPAAGPPPAGP